jgi:MFS family permease
MQFALKGYTPKQFIGLLVISSLLLMENIDANILNVAIPQMAHSFDTSVFTLKLAVTSYLIGLSIFIPISGWISDHFGTKKTLMLSIVLFTLMSIQCGLTDSVVWLVICRLLQGLAGAFMVPVGRLLLLKIFSKEQMVKAYTLMGMPVLLGPILAPIVGGYLVTYFSWRYIFWVNVPLGILAFYATVKFIDNYTEKQEKFNFYSYIFLAACLCCVCFWLDIFLLPDATLFTKGMLFSGALFFGIVYYYVPLAVVFFRRLLSVPH